MTRVTTFPLRSCFAGTDAASSAAATTFSDMPVLRFAADKSLINVNNTHELAEIFVRQTGADTMTHVPSGLVRTETHVPFHLKGANPLLAGQQQMDDAEPLAKVDIGVLEYRADQHRKPIAAAGSASVANPMKGGSVRLDRGIATAGP